MQWLKGSKELKLEFKYVMKKDNLKQQRKKSKMKQKNKKKKMCINGRID